MPSHCCVPLCSQQGYRLSNGEKVSYFNFPKDKTARKQWIHAIRPKKRKAPTVRQPLVPLVRNKTCNNASSTSSQVHVDLTASIDVFISYNKGS